MFEPLSDGLNHLGFEIRNSFWGRLKLRGSGPCVSETPAISRERSFYRLLIRKAMPEPARRLETDLLWDVGCRNWSYAKALAESFPQARLLGIEVDGARRYWNLYRRRDLAEAFAREIIWNPGSRSSSRDSQEVRARCVFEDFSRIQWDRIAGFAQGTRKWLFAFFFPFVSIRPCLKWGLPSRYACFESLIEHSLRLSQGQSCVPSFLSAHQGDWEQEIALKAYERHGLRPRTQRVFPKEFQGLWPSPYDVTLIHAECVR